LCNLLVTMGAKIKGIGSSHLTIDGVEGLSGCEYEVMPDRIEAGSYACAAGITGGSIDLIGARPEDMQATLNALAQCGLMVEFHNRGIKVSAHGALKPLALSTSPILIGARPEDMQATLNALAQCGLMVEFHNRGIKVSAHGALKPLALSTSPF